MLRRNMHGVLNEIDIPGRGRVGLWQPPLPLAGCLRAVLVARATASTHSFFPATPLATLLLWREGRPVPMARPGFVNFEMPAERGAVQIAGPSMGPSVAACDGPAELLHLLFHADALHAMTGVALAPLAQRIVPAEGQLPPDWLAALEQIAAQAGLEERLDALVNFLLPRWQPLHQQHSAPKRYADWGEALLLRAATSSAGRSLRQVERRIRAWAGLSMREVRAISRAERVFFDAVAAGEGPGPGPDWAQLALDGDYADQSHLCRETRRITGFSPADLHQRIAQDPAFWAYRLWR